MPKPRQDLRPNRRFPHCPNEKCRFHLPDDDWRYHRFGRHTRKSDGRTFVRYRCRSCRRTFCIRTFSSDYWLRYRELLPIIAGQAVQGSGLRQIGRNLGIAHSTAQRHLARAGRHCLLFHTREMRDFEITEPVAFDGFETFEWSQYFPYHINLLAGAGSTMVYGFTDSPLRRKGSMTDAQKACRAELEAEFGRPDPKAVRKGILALLQGQRFSRNQARLRSDEHPAYVQALADLRKERPDLQIEHRTTSSKEPRTFWNPLFAVNLNDLLLRHGGANQKRETIAFNKRRQGGLEHAAVFLVHRNYIKKWRENDRVEQGQPGRDVKRVRAGRGGLVQAKNVQRTAATVAGLVKRALGWADVFRRRIFVHHLDLPKPWDDYYWRRIRTVALGDRQTVHALKYAF